MTDYVKLRETIERGGADKYHEAAEEPGKLFARERIASWSTRAASSRTAGTPTPWPTGCPPTAS